MRPRKCRIWWPKDLSLAEPPISNASLFGWFLSSSSDSVDIVVAFSCDEERLPDSQLDLQGLLRETNEKMTVLLQEKSVFSLLGQYRAGCCTNGSLETAENEDRRLKSSTSGNVDAHMTTGSNYMKLVCDSQERFEREAFWIPKLHCLRWNGRAESQCDVHLIIYEVPTYGGHHFSIRYRNSAEKEKAPRTNPNWVDKLHRKQPLCDMETVVMGLNSAMAARILFQEQLNPKGISRFFAILWHVFAILVASLFTVLYVMLQTLHNLSNYGSRSWIYTASTNIFNYTCLNIQFRCSQILYWPISLQDRGIRSQSCAEYAEKAALQRHFIWSSLAADVILGNFLGFALLCYAESASSLIINFSEDFTNGLLRSGCVWLMGVPAGFKLNTELAEVIGIISLTAIQIWSTVWVFVGSNLTLFIKGLAILGIVLGATIPFAVVIDFISLAMIHVTTIHSLISVVYSTQIQVIASLWRLFRGQKWNPFRQRLDSYEYTVKQHVVGSLLFTPLLLLLPTTSVFYIFFSILDTTINLVSVLIGATISAIHATPYVKVLLRLIKPRRFPSGIWFDVKPGHDDVTNSCEDSSQRRNDTSKKSSSFMVSFLHSNFMTLGQVVLPHYRDVLSGISRSSIAALAHRLLTGKRIGSPSAVAVPSPKPWISLPSREYWRLCRDSIMECY